VMPPIPQIEHEEIPDVEVEEPIFGGEPIPDVPDEVADGVLETDDDAPNEQRPRVTFAEPDGRMIDERLEDEGFGYHGFDMNLPNNHAQDPRSDDSQDDDYDPRSDESQDEDDSDPPSTDDSDESDETPDDPEEPAPESPIGHNLRPNRRRNYDHRLGHIMDEPASGKSYDAAGKSYDAAFLQQGHDDEDGPMTLREAVQEMQLTGENHDVLKHITGIIMTQMSAKAGIKKHGQVAIDALFEEFAQLHDLGVFLPQDGAVLTRNEKRGALRAISVVKEKRCGRIKGRTVADGRPQRELYSKDETSSPTVSTDALMLSLLIDAHERRDVATADVAGAYLHANMEDFTLLKMEGESVDIMCSVDKNYTKYVCYENGKKVLYLKLLKALYGCVQSALLWYELFSTTLQASGFELNPYDTCVANKTIDGKQCTIAWYVDDNKISHVDDKVVTQVIKMIEK
jgi:hypothetical protein